MIGLGKNAYTFSSNIIVGSSETSFWSINIETINIDDIFDFIGKYGYWNCLPMELEYGIEKYINIKKIIGNDIIYRQFYNRNKKLCKFCFFKNIIIL